MAAKTAAPTFKIASWNVNSIRTRLDQILRWLKDREVHVLALQETKVPDDEFPLETIEKAGYQAFFAGQKSYNGVALLYRGNATEVDTTGGGINTDEKRLLAATIGGVYFINLYVVNGSEVGSDRYQHKLQWLAQVQQFIAAALSQHERVVVLGDFNIAPTDADVHDPNEWRDCILCSAPERQALSEILALGLADTFRLFQQPPATFSWWHYSQNNFSNNTGLRIDLLLSSATLAECCYRSIVDRQPRTWQRPSDHAPLLAEFALL